MVDVEKCDDLDFDDDFDDIPVKEDNFWDKIVDWVAGHKVLSIVLVIGIPILTMILGAKLFGKTETVEIEKLPDPTIMDKFDCVPQDMTTYTTYKFIPKVVEKVTEKEEM